MSTESQFTPFRWRSLDIHDRVVMARMTCSFSPSGIPTREVAACYAKRAASEEGLILPEGTVIEPVAASNVLHFYGEQALKGSSNFN